MALNSPLTALLGRPGARTALEYKQLLDDLRARRMTVPDASTAGTESALQAQIAAAQNLVDPELVKAQAEQAGAREYAAGLAALPQPTDPIASMQFPDMPAMPERTKRPTAKSPSITPMEGLGIALSALIAPQAAPSVATGIAQGAQQRAEAANQEAIAQWEAKQAKDEADYKDRIFRRQTAVSEDLLRKNAQAALAERKLSRSKEELQARVATKTSDALVGGLTLAGSSARSLKAAEARTELEKFRADIALRRQAQALEYNQALEHYSTQVALGQIESASALDKILLKGMMDADQDAKSAERQHKYRMAEQSAGFQHDKEMAAITLRNQLRVVNARAGGGSAAGPGGRLALAWSKEKADSLQASAKIAEARYSALSARLKGLREAPGANQVEIGRLLNETLFAAQAMKETALQAQAYSEAGQDVYTQRNADGSLVVWTWGEEPYKDPKTGAVKTRPTQVPLVGTRFQMPAPKQPVDYGRKGTDPARTPASVAAAASGGESVYSKRQKQKPAQVSDELQRPPWYRKRVDVGLNQWPTAKFKP